MYNLPEYMVALCPSLAVGALLLLNLVVNQVIESMDRKFRSSYTTPVDRSCPPKVIKKFMSDADAP